MKNILITTQDSETYATVSDYLSGHGFAVGKASTRCELDRIMARSPVDLLLLDLDANESGNQDIVRELGETSAVGIITISDPGSSEADRVLCLESGADDCIVKPLAIRELLARIRAVLRRICAAPPTSERKPSLYRFAGWEFSTRTRRLTAPTGKHVPLTRNEVSLLSVFIGAERQVLSREQLINASRVHGQDVFDRCIDVQILRLRRKLERDPSAPRVIQTERGVGYVFAAAVERG